MSISSNLAQIKSQLPARVSLVAVSKTKPVADLMEAYQAGQRIFGENYVQELVEKQTQLPNDIEWHFLGHLQSRKVKLIAPFVSLIHGVDSLKLLIEINKEAKKNNRVINCLLQIHIAQEETKFGLNEIEVFEIINADELKSLSNICIVGCMAMASFTNNQTQIENEFQKIKFIFDSMQKVSKSQNLNCTILSIGMSGDYKIAIDCGSTMVRIGSSIFGNR